MNNKHLLYYIFIYRKLLIDLNDIHFGILSIILTIISFLILFISYNIYKLLYIFYIFI